MPANESTPLKRCSKCGEVFPATSEYFNKHGETKDRLRPDCKSCQHSYRQHWSKNNPTYDREYCATHAEERQSYNRAWRENNPEYFSRYHKTNKAKNRVKVQQRRARKLSADGTHTVADIAAQLKRQKGRCYYAACGHCKLGDTYHVDHVVPLSRGGRNSPDNLVIACDFCNKSKGVKLPHEWLGGGRLI